MKEAKECGRLEKQWDHDVRKGMRADTAELRQAAGGIGKKLGENKGTEAMKEEWGHSFFMERASTWMIKTGSIGGRLARSYNSR